MDIAFYHLHANHVAKSVPRLLEKIFSNGHRCVVVAGSTERVEALNSLLWTYAQGSFLPHGSKEDGNAAAQPIWLTTEFENPNQATVLVSTDGMGIQETPSILRYLDVFDGTDDESLRAARKRWKHHQAQGDVLTYWQQDEAGQWQNKTPSAAD
ncbi:MAG: DNA polymerase III subunit chi [Holosporales bacterium]